MSIVARLAEAYPGAMARLFVAAITTGCVAHATRSVWWPYCKPDQLVIGGSVASRLQTTEAKLAPGERLEVTTFVTVATGDVDGLEVTTGTKFTSLTAAAPARSYCYAALPGQGRRAVVDLGDRLGWGGVSYRDVSAEQAAFVGRKPQELMELARSACRWMEKGEPS